MTQHRRAHENSNVPSGNRILDEKHQQVEAMFQLLLILNELDRLPVSLLAQQDAAHCPINNFLYPISMIQYYTISLLILSAISSSVIAQKITEVLFVIKEVEDLIHSLRNHRTVYKVEMLEKRLLIFLSGATTSIKQPSQILLLMRLIVECVVELIGESFPVDENSK